MSALAKQARMPRHAAERFGARVVNRAAQRLTRARSWRDARGKLGAGTKSAAAQPERREDRRARERIEIRARDALDDRAEHEIAEIAIDELVLARGDRQDARERCLLGAVVVGERVGGRQPRHVQHELADRHGAKRGGGFGQMPMHRIVERELAAIDERHHRRGGGDGFGEAREVEHRVGRHRLARRDLAQPVGAFEHDAPVMNHPDDRAGDLAAPQLLGDRRVEARLQRG